MNNTEAYLDIDHRDSVEALRLILQRQQARVVTCEEAAEVGEALMTFFEVLSTDEQQEDSGLATSQDGESESEPWMHI